jgi:hypothetical protein
MATQAQTEANRANAQKSTGPATEEGKAASSQNGWKHGLFGVFRVLENEDQVAYTLFLADLIDEHQPTTPTETILVENMAQHHWLRNRALYFQSHYFDCADGPDTAKISLFMRYENMHERAFHKCRNELIKLRAEKKKEEIGFALQEHKAHMREMDLLGARADYRFRETRAIGVEFRKECDEKRWEWELQDKTGRSALQQAA